MTYRQLPIVPAIALILALSLPLLGSAFAQTRDSIEVTLVWKACSEVDEDGRPLACAVRYEVLGMRDGTSEARFASTEGDTTCTVAVEPGSVYRLRIIGYDEDDRPSVPSEWSDPIYYDPAQGRELAELPEGPTLRPNAPNPFNPSTRIRYGIPEDVADNVTVALEIYNLRGQRVRTFDVERSAGWYEVMWDGTNQNGVAQPTGMYVSRFICGDRVETRKMTMVK